MPYRYTHNEDYTDFAAGRVFYSLPGHAAFPVRLTSELFQRCYRAWTDLKPRSTLAVVYDPCCGGAYHLCVLAFLHWEVIGSMIGSDIAAEAIALASRNLCLLSSDGMTDRAQELQALLDAYGKRSHREALESAWRMASSLARFSQHHEVLTYVFQADATDRNTLCRSMSGRRADIVIADVPYGRLSTWGGASPVNSGELPLQRMLDALLPVLADRAVIGIAADKSQTLAHKAYRRLDHFQIGRRRLAILTPASVG